MSTQNHESFYNKLLEASVLIETEEIANLFEEDFVKDVSKVNWILTKAIKYQDIKIINFLISSGVKIDTLNNANQTALHLAAYDDFFEIIDSLFEHCNNDINYADVNGLTHFHIACITGNVAMAEHFLTNGVDANIRYRSNVPNECKEFTPLHFAVKYVRVQIVELLLKYGADPNSVDYFKATPLHLICRGVSRGIKKPKRRQNSLLNEDTLEAFVGQREELTIIQLLVHCGGDLNAMEDSGNTPLFYIFQDDYLDQINSIFHPLINDVHTKYKIVQEFRKKQKQKVEFLLENNADVKTRNNNGETVLHIAINELKLLRRPKMLPDLHFDDSINVEIIELFLKHGADVNAKNNKNESPLQIAISLLSFDIVKILINYNADMNCIKFYSGNDNSFHYYTNVLPCLEATENLIEIIDILSKKGFYLSQKDNLIVLKFFVYNNIDCRYADSEDENAPYKLKNLLELGASVNIKNTLNKFPENISSTSYTEQSMKKQMIYQLYKHLTILEIGSLYVSAEIRDCIKSKIQSLDRCIFKFISNDKSLSCDDVASLEDEIQKMKTIMLNGFTTLHDILRINPHDVYFRIKNCDYKSIFESNEFKQNFPHCGGIIKGHFAKSLIRRYILNSSIEYLRCLTTMRLPDLCCERIFNYLSNENLLNLCLALNF